MHAIITGATSGIGLELAKNFAELGYNLLLVGRREDRLIKSKEDFEKKFNVKVDYIKCDLSKEEECNRLIEYSKKYDDIEIVVNSAGCGKVGDFYNIEYKDDMDMIFTNLIAVHILTKYFSKVMKKGTIVNIASVAGACPTPHMATYGATKAYVKSYGLAANYELRKAKSPIRIVTVCPGPIDTEFNEMAGVEFALAGMPVDKCAKVIMKAVKRRKMLSILPRFTKLLYLGTKICPMSLILPIEYKIQSSKNG